MRRPVAPGLEESDVAVGGHLAGADRGDLLRPGAAKVLLNNRGDRRREVGHERIDGRRLISPGENSR
jgi:hypothetical protein